jgi:NosR/NirI family nitrous oxide reductase transcriptional regulator
MLTGIKGNQSALALNEKRKSRMNNVIPKLNFVNTVTVLLIVLASLSPVSLTLAAQIETQHPYVHEFFPDADRFGPVEGDPPAAAVYRKNRLLGYVFLTNDVSPIPAYSGKPINTVIGLDTRGRITGARIVEHHEPILLAGISEKQLKQFIDQYPGLSVFDQIRIGGDTAEGKAGIDTISGASITVMVANASITRSAKQVAESRGLPLTGAESAPITVVQKAKPGSAVPDKTVAPRETQLPEKRVEPTYEPMWIYIWKERAFQVVVLVLALLLLTVIMLFQDWIVRRPVLYERLRMGYLLFTVFFIGWYALAQLSIVNVFTFINAVFHDFHWETFALDPLMFILWGFVAMTLLLWGRGVYCGWLCPFGAAQELINHFSRRFGVRQWEFPYVVHERLWALKYIILIALFGVSLQSLADAERMAEIEPFKTAVLLQFQREWPFVVYAVGLLLVSIVNRKFYCKYLCPLGAALVIPAQNRLFNWVRRRNECGKPCQVCANECEVRAIAPTGEINKNECHYCLDCQVTYYNDHKCPPLVHVRKQRERRENTRQEAT